MSDYDWAGFRVISCDFVDRVASVRQRRSTNYTNRHEKPSNATLVDAARTNLL